MEKSRLYTATGDSGTTSLVGGQRVKKSDLRLEAYGTVDEINANLGVLISNPTLDTNIKTVLCWAQNKLFNIGAYLATPVAPGTTNRPDGLDMDDVRALEQAIDYIDSQLPPLHCFVLPGGSHRAAVAHVCRTVCRRAERVIVALADTSYVAPDIIKFINRLSDFLFASARFCNVDSQTEESAWDKNATFELSE